MSTRGAVGFRIDGVDKITYNHSDSYPSWLGEQVTAFIRKNRRNGKLFNRVVKEVKTIRVVDSDSIPTQADQTRYAHLFQNVSTGKRTEWYALIRGLQGNLEGMVDEGIMLDGQITMNESLYTEWAYIVNLDTNTLEIYRGFVHEPGKGRYADAVPTAPVDWTPRYNSEQFYFPVTLIAEIPFSNVPHKGKLDTYLTETGAVVEEEV